MSVNKIFVNNSDSNYTHSIFDISEYTGNSYSTLSDALDAIPQAKHKGGMTIRYVQTNDNKYVQYRLMSDSFTTDVAQWQGVDNEPKEGSHNLLESGAAFDELYYNTGDEEETVLCNAYSEGGSYVFDVDYRTGEFIEGSVTYRRSIEIQLPQNAISIKYTAIPYSVKECGYAFLDNNDNLILGVKTTVAEEITVDCLQPMANGATKFRCGLNSDDTTDIPIKMVVQTFKSLKDRISDLEQGMSGVMKFSDCTDEAEPYNTNPITSKGVYEETNLITPKDIVIKTDAHSESGSFNFNVSSVNGTFVQTSTNNSRAIEIELPNNAISVTFVSRSFIGDYGYAFVDENGDFVSGVKTTTAEEITVDCIVPLQNGAKKFRYSYWSQDTTNIPTSVKMAYAESLKDILTDIVGAKKQPYKEGTIRFTFPTQHPETYNVINNASKDSVSETQATGAGLLRLAYNYTPIGKSSKLAVFFCGSGDYQNFSYTEFNLNLLPYIDYLCKCGYCVLSPYAWDNTRSGVNFATPYSLSNYVRACKYVFDNYNVDTSGVYVWGRSAGGTNILTFALHSGIPVKAMAFMSTQIIVLTAYGTTTSPTTERNNLIADTFNGDPNYELTQQYLEDNFYKWAPYEPMLGNLVSDLTISQKVAKVLSGDLGSSDYIKAIQIPTKIWMPDDDIVAVTPMKNLFNNILNGGGLCEYRQMPSNYTDDRVLEPNPHHVVDYTGPSSDVTTPLGYECENVANAYIEMFDFFDRF